MSLTTMGRGVTHLSTKAGLLQAKTVDPTVDPAAANVADRVSAVVMFIPSETLTLYLAWHALLEPTPVMPATVAFWTCLALSPLWVLLTRFNTSSATNPFVFPYWAIIAAPIAFFVYVVSVDAIWLQPALARFQEISPKGFGAIAILLISPLLAALNVAVGKRWPEQKVESR
jgi:hypothetical protein